MSFIEVVDQVIELLRTRGRVSYHALKREFDLDEAFIADLKEELINIQELAADKDGKMLVWIGDGAQASTEAPTSTPQPQPPASYTPPHLAERILAEQAAMEARGSADGERKTITALFTDLKGSTALIEGLDPEEARAIIDPALQLMMDAVHRYDGYVAQALGDGIFALFSALIAHEDYPQSCHRSPYYEGSKGVPVNKTLIARRTASIGERVQTGTALSSGEREWQRLWTMQDERIDPRDVVPLSGEGGTLKEQPFQCDLSL